MDRRGMHDSRPQAGHRRSKSSTAVFKSIITGSSRMPSSREKENTTPPSTAATNAAPMSTPIWEEFNKSASRRPKSRNAPTSKLPLNDRTIEQEISLYTPKDQTSSKQSQAQHEELHGPPALTRKERPRSVMERSKSAITIFESIARTGSKDADDKSELTRKVVAKGNTSKVPLKAEGGTERVAKATRAASRDLLTMAKRGTKVMGLVAVFNKSSNAASPESVLNQQEVDAAFEAVLESRNIPENMRKNLRLLKPTVKASLIKSNDVDFSAMTKSKPTLGTMRDKTSGTPDEIQTREKDLSESDKKVTKRSRPRSRTFTLSRSKKTKAEEEQISTTPSTVLYPSTPTTLDGRGSFDGGRSVGPCEFVEHLQTERIPQMMSVGKIHKLRQLLRNETVAWVEKFVEHGGLTEIVNLLYRIMNLEWREDHEDQLLHESLLCLKALCTTDSALRKLSEIEDTLFRQLLGMLFDKERKGPSEFHTRQIIISVLLAHLKGAIKDPILRVTRARTILGYLSDEGVKENELPFIAGMRQSRPYKVWHQELSSVASDVFWIFLHHHNIVALPTETEGTSTRYADAASMECDLSAEEYALAHFPRPRPPVPAAPYVGGVEWEATNYMAVHIDLLNGLIAALPTKEERNSLRAQLRASYWEKTMGGMLRACKEKFYSCIHDALRHWVAAAVADGWDVRDVRTGPKIDKSKSPRKSPAKNKDDKVPKLEAPKLDLNLNLTNVGSGINLEDDVQRWI